MCTPSFQPGFAPGDGPEYLRLKHLNSNPQCEGEAPHCESENFHSEFLNLTERGPDYQEK